MLSSSWSGSVVQVESRIWGTKSSTASQTGWPGGVEALAGVLHGFEPLNYNKHEGSDDASTVVKRRESVIARRCLLKVHAEGRVTSSTVVSV